MRSTWSPEQSDDFLLRPDVIRNPSRHRGRDPKRLVNLREIVMHEMQCDGVRVILNLFENPSVSRVKRRMCILIVRF